MLIELCRLTREVKLSTANINGEDKPVFNNAVAIRIDKNNAAFVDITAWGKTAETMAKYFKKGDELLIKGELRNKRTKLQEKEITAVYILVTSFEFTHGISKREDERDTGGNMPPEE